MNIGERDFKHLKDNWGSWESVERCGFQLLMLEMWKN